MQIKLNDDVIQLIDYIHANGGICYLTGGYLRDIIMGNVAYDIDVEVHKIPFTNLVDLLTKKYKIEVIGKFAIIKIKDFPYIDIACPRQEIKIGQKHTDFQINIDENLSTYKASLRRDFTMNALMYNLKTGKLIDHFNGVDDIKEKKIRHISDKFSEDNLRVLRAINFVSRFDLTIDKTTYNIMKNMSLEHISAMRINKEFEKIITGKYVHKALPLLNDLAPDIFAIHKPFKQNYFRFVSGEFIANTTMMLYLYSNTYEVTKYITSSKKDKYEIENILLILEASENYHKMSKVNLFNILQRYDNYQLNANIVMSALQKCEFRTFIEKKHSLYVIGLKKYTGQYFLQKDCEPKKIKEFQKLKIIDML